MMNTLKKPVFNRLSRRLPFIFLPRGVLVLFAAGSYVDQMTSAEATSGRKKNGQALTRDAKQVHRNTR